MTEEQAERLLHRGIRTPVKDIHEASIDLLSSDHVPAEKWRRLATRTPVRRQRVIEKLSQNQ